MENNYITNNSHSGIVEQVSLDLQNEFPGVQGFSTRNLWNMKKWYLFYASNERLEKLQQLVAELGEIPSIKLEQIVSLRSCTQPSSLRSGTM